MRYGPLRGVPPAGSADRAALPVVQHHVRVPKVTAAEVTAFNLGFLHPERVIIPESRSEADNEPVLLVLEPGEAAALAELGTVQFAVLVRDGLAARTGSR